MEHLSETPWDVVISGTGLQQSLLALALSRSGKKVLHVDPNDYYGGSEAAFSLQEAEEWVEQITAGKTNGPFSKSSIWRAEEPVSDSNNSEKLSFSRSYTLSLSPQIIHARSKLLARLVSSKAYQQLEFVPVGNWWIYSVTEDGKSLDSFASGALKRLPNGREDIFGDRTIDLRAKRKVMNFLKFVVDYENQEQIWRTHADSSLPEFLYTEFQLPPSLQAIILALTLSLDLPRNTTVQYSLPRIARHITSIGVFGPGFGWIIPKWGGGSEIAQVACRAGAVGGGVYVLGTGVESLEEGGGPEHHLTLTQYGTVITKHYVHSQRVESGSSTSLGAVSRMVSIVSSELASLFAPTVEGAPTSAVAVVTMPPQSYLVNGPPEEYPVYIMAHSSHTGECPVGQCVLYASTSASGDPKARMELAVSTLLSSFASTDPSTAEAHPKLLYKMYYEQSCRSNGMTVADNICAFPDTSLDLSFDETILDDVETAWRSIMGFEPKDRSSATDGEDSLFMVFESREQRGEDEAESDP